MCSLNWNFFIKDLIEMWWDEACHLSNVASFNRPQPGASRDMRCVWNTSFFVSNLNVVTEQSIYCFFPSPRRAEILFIHCVNRPFCRRHRCTHAAWIIALHPQCHLIKTNMHNWSSKLRQKYCHDYFQFTGPGRRHRRQSIPDIQLSTVNVVAAHD